MTREPSTNDSAELVPIRIDGVSYSAPREGNLLQFMLEHHIEVSYFCYHPGLSVVAVCRQCLVELKGSAKLVPACQTRIAADMEVSNHSPRVLEARRQQLEFTLLNHPVDCPICDKAGECALQRHYMVWDHQPSRLDHAKVHKPKRVEIGPRVLLDAERCILCSRCVRFCAEVVDDPQLVIAARGDHSVLTTAPGCQLDNAYSLNTVDICPVGALTDRDFRFQARVWELSATPSVCTGCATGCELEIHHARNRIYRLVPRRAQDINRNWMCDAGRLRYHEVYADRLAWPRLGEEEGAWEQAITRISELLLRLDETGRRRTGIVLGADATNEDNYLAARLARDVLGTTHLYLAAAPEGDAGDRLLRHSDPNPNRAGALACGGSGLRSALELAQDLQARKLRALYVLGDTLELSPEALEQATALDVLVVQAAHLSPLVRRAHVALPAAMWPEVDGTITNCAGKVQRLRAAVRPPGAARPHWQALAQLARRAELPVPYSSAREVFAAMVQDVELFAQAGWGEELATVQLRYAGSRG